MMLVKKGKAMSTFHIPIKKQTEMVLIPGVLEWLS